METMQPYLPYIITSIPLMFICHGLAKEKGKNVTLWTILGLIPGVNIYCLLYLFGASSRILEGKIDKILAQIQRMQPVNLPEKKNREEAIQEVEGKEV